MASFRDIKRKARRELHERLQVSALYIVGDDDPVPVNVRVHTKFDALGDMKGTNFHFAEREEPLPRILFMRDEISRPMKNAIISISATEAYYVDHSDPPDDISVTSYVVVIRPDELIPMNLPVPEVVDG